MTDDHVRNVWRQRKVVRDGKKERRRREIFRDLRLPPAGACGQPVKKKKLRTG